MSNNQFKIGIGSAQFGMNYGISNSRGQTSTDEVKLILDTCLASNIKYIDTASSYGNAEEILGLNDLTNFRVTSKFMHCSESETIFMQLDTSLEKLGIDSLYGYLAHRPLELLDKKHWTLLQSAKNVGKVKKVGFSLNEVEELDILLKEGLYPDIIQVPYNYLDCRFEPYMVFLKERGCEIHTRSTFLQGLFFKDPNKLGSYFEGVKSIIQQLQNETHVLEGALLNYVISKPFIDVVMVGVETQKQLIKNIHSLECVEMLPTLKQKISETILVPSKWPSKL